MKLKKRVRKILQVQEELESAVGHLYHARYLAREQGMVCVEPAVDEALKAIRNSDALSEILGDLWTVTG